MVATCIVLHRRWSTGAVFGSNLAGAVGLAGIVLIGISFAILIISYRSIDPWTLMAGPQITGTSRELITDGIYAHIRHPRYLILITGALGNFLVTGTGSLLIAFIVTTTLTIIMTRVEEKELRSQFGNAYDDYARRVPAFIPRRRVA
jgi:protein-S-isoprenylcysteine O-methyltransferase Ste14